MSSIAVQAEDLGKRFLMRQRHGYAPAREWLEKKLRMPIQQALSLVSKKTKSRTVKEETESEYYWALKNASFQILQGQAVGLIGPNGAGKSVLLKILSRITQPTEGYAEVRGRVGSMLQMGSGFHPELTGRENIYLSASLLGLRKADILRKFDAIVFFSDVESFLDTPVKHYSNGMALRLGFAIAVHLESEILFLDEVLSVGDKDFKAKCISKIQEIIRQGRTVFFVSHDMGEIRTLCSRSLLLNKGRLLLEGPTEEVVEYYLAMSREVKKC